MLTLTRRAAVPLVVVGVLAAPAAAGADTYDPPPWFREATAVVKARGGTCEPIDRTQSPLYPTEIQHTVGLTCLH